MIATKLYKLNDVVAVIGATPKELFVVSGKVNPEFLMQKLYVPGGEIDPRDDPQGWVRNLHKCYRSAYFRASPAEAVLDENRRSFFADCPRDKKGRCLPMGGSGVVETEVGGKVVTIKAYRATKEQLDKARKIAAQKYAKAPKPTDADRKKFWDFIKAGREFEKFLKKDKDYRRCIESGGKKSTCRSEAKVRFGKPGGTSADYEVNIRPNKKDRDTLRRKLIKEFGDGKKAPCVYCGLILNEKTVSMDKIYTAPEGGRYKYHNVVCSCEKCNKKRGATLWKDIVWNPISNR